MTIHNHCGMRRLLLGCAFALLTTSAQAQTATVHVPDQALAQSLKDIASQTGTNILFAPDAVSGVKAHALDGQMSAHDAVAQLLAGSDLEVVSDPSGGLVVRKREGAMPKPQQHADAAAPGGETVVVTGTRIRGADITSPVVSLTQEQMHDQGFTNLGDVVRSLPQSYNGGQNPGVSLGSPGLNNQNLTSGSSIDLRGLGADATLTLLNGHRLSYDSFIQAVDVSVIPVDAIDRMEVLLDGASAIYGSDAVGGVANIILKRDYDGLALSARYAGATDGGGVQTEFGGTGGTIWDTGGFLVAYTHDQDGSISALQRDYTKGVGVGNNLIPGIVQNNALITAHQFITPDIEFDLDAIYSNRDSLTLHNFVDFGLTSTYTSHSTSYSISPSLRFVLPASWDLTVSGSLGRNFSSTRELDAIPSIPLVIGDTQNCYCNSAKSAEVDAEGPLFALPGGDARASVGGGWRENQFTYHSNSGNAPILAGRHLYYGYGEINLPLIGPDQNIPFVSRLVLNGAGRFEDYSDFGSVATPKIGVLWGVGDDLDIKGSWGKSFKAPTLFQEFQPRVVQLNFASFVGDSVDPPDSTALLVQGGQQGINPERATTYTVGFSAHPHWLDGFRADVDYFHINYTNRIVLPIQVINAALSDPSYAGYLTPFPSQSLSQDFINGAQTFVNFTHAPIDFSKIVAIIDDRYTNATRQLDNGVDVSLAYATDLELGSLNASANLTWLQGTQQNTPTAPTMGTVGYIFNPPKFRARGGATWSYEGLSLSSFVNFVGAVVDNQNGPNKPGSSMTTLDLAAVWRPEAIGPIDNFEIALSASNVFDQHPPLFAQPFDFYVNYDSTNYSAVGRFLSLTLTKRL